MNLEIGDAVKGQVTAIKPYGAFVRLPNGDIGLVHISEVAEEYVKDVATYLAVGQEVTVKIIGRNEEGKFNLSIKQVTRQDEEAAKFRAEVEQVRSAYKRKEEQMKEVINRRRPPATCALVSWMKEAKAKLEELEKKRNLRLRSYGQLSQTKPSKEKEGR